MEKYLGKDVIRYVFEESNEDWKNINAAQSWLRNCGYSYGSLDCNNPIAIKEGEYDLPQKWHNFTELGKQHADGVIVAERGDFRNGKVSVLVFMKPTV